MLLTQDGYSEPLDATNHFPGPRSVRCIQGSLYSRNIFLSFENKVTGLAPWILPVHCKMHRLSCSEAFFRIKLLLFWIL